MPYLGRDPARQLTHGRNQHEGSDADGTQATHKSAATTGYGAELWAMADGLRGSTDAAEYKHVMVGLVAELREQQAEGARLDAAIARNLALLGFGGGGDGMPGDDS